MVDLITEHIDIWTTAQEQPARGRGRKTNGHSPYGIKKLRELILELAVCGKLVPQDPSDEPASVLLKKIAQEKARLIQKGEIKKQKKLSEITDDEKVFKLPEGWEWARLEEYAKKITDGEHISPKKTSEGIMLLTAKHVLDNGVSTDDPQYVATDDAAKFRLRCDPEVGDVLICSRGTIGRCCVVKIADYFCLMGSVIQVRTFEEVDPYYLNIYLKSGTGQLFIRGVTKGMAVNALYLKDIRLSPLPLAPLAEQHRIVAKVDELMALCDQLEQQQTNSNETHQTLVETLLTTLTNAADQKEFADTWHRIAAHFDTLFTTEQSITHLKQTILQLAVIGKLVPQNPTDEPASTLLEKIAKEKTRLIKEGKIKKQKMLPEISDEEKPFELPEGWEWCNLSDLFAIVTDGDHQAPPKSDTGVPFLVIGNLNTGEVALDGCRYVPEDYYQNLDWSRQPIAGDLLYTVTGSYGIPILVDSDANFCVQRHVAILKSTKSSPRKYLLMALASKCALDYATEIATGIAQKTVPLTGLRRMPTPVAPENEQQRIVAKVDELLALCDQMQSKLTSQRTTTCHLADAFVQQATIS
ncbi:MAG: restriction endonuclease subunit S [Proteobacteria bacterium]|nr:restriction endonuclease subunit S [Pseudomonadota bacterium]